MTTASAPATPTECGNTFIRHTKNTIASLSSRHKEILDQITQLQQSQSQALTDINNRIENIAPRDISDSEKDIDTLVNNLKSRRRRSSAQQQSVSSIPQLEFSLKEDNRGSMQKTAKQVTHRLNKEQNADLLSTGELDLKYLSAENNNTTDSDSCDDTISNNLDNSNAKDTNETINRRANKLQPGLTINTKSLNSKRRPLTPESSDSEFDMASAHLQITPSLMGKGSLRRRYGTDNNQLDFSNRSRPASMLYTSMEEIEEEASPFSDNGAGEGSKAILPASKLTTASVNGRRLSSLQKFSKDSGDITSRINRTTGRRPDDRHASTEIADDNSSVVSGESLLEELGNLKSRIQRLESEHIDSPIDRRRRRFAYDMMSPSVTSPNDSQGTSSTATSSSSRSTVSAQHQKHLQNAFEFFEKAFPTMISQSTEDASPAPSRSMAMVVSTALLLNQRFRSILAQPDMDPQNFERTMKDLLKTSDEQVRSLTECLLALGPLAQRAYAVRKITTERNYQQNVQNGRSSTSSSILGVPTATHTNRSVSPSLASSISRLPIANGSTQEIQTSYHEMQQGTEQGDQADRRTSPVSSAGPTSPTLSYYGGSRTTLRYNRSAYQVSANLPSESVNDFQQPSRRTLESRERRSRRSSGGSISSFSGTLPSSPSPPPLPTQNEHESTTQSPRPVVFSVVELCVKGIGDSITSRIQAKFLLSLIKKGKSYNC
ncbi:10401_t:CDS:2 [Paraglomus occultum]|uniref:10401_t:CDS:1 n=1 Tax=Paraglomus occultum TaxID=144539 RepID=A0A9N8ZZX2_9GLOM|nr:10401_t:CDS:2 [Paraglomus occultum]